ncbi:GntR family transcriptional regulator [Neptunomonas japonica]|uniref:GntR family transcriptional regulator n=1 Tax=Neptunomonas japonica JAMM 1380 TaxID=1441457 RepID=A0A7R6SVC3_9GAMM|nr:GntR family transcriptional regulator [Neptunomonas japonica]BBB29251.1 GntR family transcriptional regulator [Neptunomonas japonica JAMM 1380]
MALQNRAAQDEVIYGHIFDAILEQKLAPGTKLSEESLGDIFGVSRTVIHRALSRLAHEKVIVLRPNKGAMVASPTVDEAKQILFARRVIEKTVIELATENVINKQLGPLRKLVKEEQDCFARGDRGTGLRLSGEFHLQLAEVSGNKSLHSFLRSLVSQSSLIIALYESDTQTHCSYDEHLALIDAVAAKDKERALLLMEHHLDHVEQKLTLHDENTKSDLKAVFSNVLV